ncbi:serine/threonine-protein kinase, active site protein [Artemisia annua]|uniref:Serine/threonine-protein kinase, active site protein n=1 Tax=Artemisia annua TaxID=35608 RepID=A0A2U1NS39_ARTAN|nr:serine/threonine-protein kinase, active site protein [Artemisia annua]
MAHWWINIDQILLTIPSMMMTYGNNVLQTVECLDGVQCQIHSTRLVHQVLQDVLVLRPQDLKIFSIRGELKEELKEEMKVDLKEEMKNELKEEMDGDLKEETREVLKEEMRAIIQEMLVMVSRVMLPTNQKQNKRCLNKNESKSKDPFNDQTTKLQRLEKTLIAVASLLGSASAQNTSHCEYSCGNVTIVYPFGSGEGCYYSPDFLVTCNRSLDEPTPFYGDSSGNIVITNMSTSTSEMEIMMFVAHDCYNNVGNNTSNYPSLTLRSFRISTKNRFVAIGCDTDAYIDGTRGNVSDSTGCRTTCGTSSHITNGSCSGIGCCEIAIPEGMSSFKLFALSFDNHANITDFNPCSHAFVVNKGKYKFSSNNLFDFGNVKKMPMLLDWAIGNDTCEVAKRNMTSFLCQGNSECDQDYGGPGYRCRCKPGYEGNPYRNCTNINECDQNNGNCIHKCIDTPGSHRCPCKKGYDGDGFKDGTGCTAKRSLLIEIAICK